MILRAFYGLTHNPFDLRELELLPQQQEIHDTLKVHCQQGGLCLVLGVPGTGKSVLKQALQRLPDKQYLVATVGRTLHTYTNTVKILCDAFRVDFESNAFKCERRLIERRDVDPFEQVPAARWTIETSQQVHQSRLTGT